MSKIGEFVYQFGGPGDVITLLLIIAVFFLINSTLKNNLRRLFIAIFSSLFIILQTFSLYFTQSFVGYQFYVHANLRGITGMQGLFVVQIIVAIVSFFLLFCLNYYAYNIFKRLQSYIGSGKKSLIKIAQISSIFLLIYIVIFQGNFIADSKTLYPIFSINNKEGFKDVLQKYNMDDYVTPDEIESSPGNNIIVISLESIERGFLHDKFAALTPNLNKLKNQWQYFDLEQNSGSGWTSGALYTCLTGFPAYFGVQQNSIFQSAYHSDISSISHVLKKANYSTSFLNGNADHSGIKEMLNVFQFDRIIDNKNTPKTGHESLYGLRDLDLFNVAKSEIEMQMALQDPFAMFISTTDTHFPNGIYDQRMEAVISPKNSDLEFMVAALDYLVGDFIAFLEKNGFLENTTVYLFPDHLKMGNPYIFDNTGERGLYVITNSKNIELNDVVMYQLDLPKVILDGANVEHNLKFLTDYIQGNKEDYIQNNMLGITEINTSGILNANIEVFQINSISANYEHYKKDTLRFIAHAGGAIDGLRYTNCKEALDLSYKKGFRLFELDIIETKDGQFVAAHDWPLWGEFTDYYGELPVTREEFLSKKIFGKYTPLDMDGINDWFAEHHDAILITDKVNDPIRFSQEFIDKNRLMMELFDKRSVEEGLKSGLLSAMPSQSVVDKMSIKDIEKFSKKGGKNIAISRRYIADHQSILQEFKRLDIKPFVYHVNYDVGIDEEYVVKYEMDYIYGIYADDWTFE